MASAISKREREFHRRTAAKCFNQTWSLLVKKSRTENEDLKMLDLAHASRYHWGIVGTSRNKAIGDWQVSRVYAALGDSNLSLVYANSVLDACEKEMLMDVLHTAYEGLARAYAVAGARNLAMKWLARARARLEGLELEKDEREVYSAQIDETARIVRKVKSN